MQCPTWLCFAIVHKAHSILAKRLAGVTMIIEQLLIFPTMNNAKRRQMVACHYFYSRVEFSALVLEAL
jgi:hypothetical protein